MPVCPICNDAGELRGPGPKGTTVPCICQRPRPARVARSLLLLLAFCLAGASDGGWPW